MMRENVLALLLVLSLCANAYLIFFSHSPIDQYIPGVNGIPVADFSNISGQNNYIVDENGEIIAVSPSAAIELTPDLPPPGEDSFESPPDTPEVDQDSEDQSEGELPAPEGTLIPDTEVTEPVVVDPLVNYTSTRYGFSLRYPRNWTMNEAVAGRTVLTLVAPIETGCDSETSQCYEYIATLTVEVDQNPHTLVLEDYFNKAVSLLQLEYHITTTSKSAPAIMSNTRSYQIEYYTHDERGNADRDFMQYYAIIDGKGYILSYFGPYSSWENVYDHNKADAQGIVDSFSVTRTYKPA